jgi:hypothetical protein
MARTAVVPEAATVGALSALLRRPRPWSATSAMRRRSTRGARFYTPSAGSTGANSSKLTSARGGRHLLRGSNRQKFGRNAHTGRAFGSARSSSTPRDDGGPRRKPFVGSLAAFTAVLATSEGTVRGVSDCVPGSTVRDISGSNPSRSTMKSARAVPGSRRPLRPRRTASRARDSGRSASPKPGGEDCGYGAPFFYTILLQQPTDCEILNRDAHLRGRAIAPQLMRRRDGFKHKKPRVIDGRAGARSKYPDTSSRRFHSRGG